MSDGADRRPLPLASRQRSDAGQGQVRPTVGLIFVAYHPRRSGIGRALLRAAAEHAGVAPGELAWWTPFTDARSARPVGQRP